MHEWMNECMKEGRNKWMNECYCIMWDCCMIKIDENAKDVNIFFDLTRQICNIWSMLRGIWCAMIPFKKIIEDLIVE